MMTTPRQLALEVVVEAAREYTRSYNSLGRLDSHLLHAIDDAIAALDALDSAARENVTVSKIIAVVAKFCELDIPLLLSKQRDTRIVRARWIAMYLARQMTGQSLQQIARTLRRDHSTVLHGIRAVENTPQILIAAQAIRSFILR